MTHEIISRDTIKFHARRAVDAGQDIRTCPYAQGSSYAKRWIAAYLMREVELNEQARAA